MLGLSGNEVNNCAVIRWYGMLLYVEYQDQLTKNFQIEGFDAGK